MQASIEISLYPLADDYIPPIRDFIARLNADGRFRVETNTMSTQIFGRYEDLMAALTREIGASLQGPGRAVVVLKIVGPLAQD